MRVLLVEDDDTVREYIEDFLADDGHLVYSSSSPHSALESAELFPFPDLLIIDFNLNSHMDGVDLAEALILKNPKARLLVISGRPELAQRKLQKTLGGSVLAKPFVGRHLIVAIKKEMIRKQKSFMVGGLVAPASWMKPNE